MSLSSALSVALSGLSVSTAQLQLAASNIANAQTAGYTEKTTTTAAVILGTQVGGVEITSYNRATNAGLTASLNNATTNASLLNTSYNYLTQVQSILGSNANNPALSTALSNFQAAWTTYSSSPEDTTAQQAVLSAGSTLASTINTITSQVTNLGKQVQTDTTNTVTSLNSDLKQLQSVNNQIVSATAADQPIVDLQDQQDQIVKQIAAITNVNVIPRNNGSIALYTQDGTALLDNSAQTFTYNGSSVINSSGQDVTAALSGGSLQAEINFGSTSSAAASSTDPGTGVLTKLNAQISKLVDAFTDSSGGTTSAFATAYSGAVTASTATGASQSGDTLASTFFTVSNGSNGQPDPSTFAVTASLLNGTAELPQTNASTIAASFDATQSYTASGLSASGVTYTQLGTAILSNFQLAANTLQTSSTNATTQQSYYQSSLTTATGVNVDSELVNLTTLQNAYAASAHVISTIQSLLSTLEAITTSS